MTEGKPVSDEAAWRRDAKAFASLAKEIEAGLRRGAYQSFKINFSERRRLGEVRVPISVDITYSGRPAPRGTP